MKYYIYNVFRASSAVSGKVIYMCLFPKFTFSATPHPAGSRASPEATGWKAPATSVQPKKLLLRVGNEARAGLGGLGPAKRIHQDISFKEYS